MKDKEVLNILSKEELIKIIHEFNDRAFMGYVRKTLIVEYKSKLNQILDKQDKADLHTLGGRKEYFDLEEEYKKTEKIFERLCNVK